MVVPDRWADRWIEAWNERDLEALLALYASDVQLRSPLAKVYAQDGVVKGRSNLGLYWGEAMRRMPNFRLEKIAVYTGHLTLALHCRDHLGRNSIETVLFNDEDEAISHTACLDRVR
ncbi:hypothetical protein ACVWZA_000592 [Sphingomonas sp. UYAg733]